MTVQRIWRVAVAGLTWVGACADAGSETGTGPGTNSIGEPGDSRTTEPDPAGGTATSEGMDTTPGGTQDGTGVDVTGDGTQTSSDTSSGRSTDGPMLDPCAEAIAACPGRTAAPEAEGLVEVERCGFPMDDETIDPMRDTVIDALAKRLPVVGFDALLTDLNHPVDVVASVPGGPAGLAYAFGWDAVENDKPWWIPQGISGSADAVPEGTIAGRRVLMVSWYYNLALHPNGDSEKGARISLVDVTDPQEPRYRLMLLVDPVGTAADPDFVPVTIHAGGIAWVGDRLWVADTAHGFRVFDLTRMMQVATDEDVVGCSTDVCRAGLYKYIIPQIGRVEHDSECAPRFSFVSVDRSGDEVALVSGEYCSDSACDGSLAGRLFRWPVREDGTGTLAPRTWPSHVWLMGQRQIQGGALIDELAFLSSSAPAAGAGELYRTRSGASASSSWSDAPEDLMVDHDAGWLWSLSEHVEERFVYAAELSALPSP